MNHELTDVAPALLDTEKREDESKEKDKVDEPKPDWIKAITSSPAFVPGLFVGAAIVAMFWGLLSKLPGLWMNDDGYYTHGFLVPFISGYVIYRAWPAIRNRTVKPVYWVGLLMLPVAFVAWAAMVSDVDIVMSFMLIFTLLIGVCFIAGWRWLLALGAPIVYLAFALPIWTGIIHDYTNPLQTVSTKISYVMLKLMGLDPRQLDSTTIMLNRFSLDVGVPCSGLKLLLAISAFTIFFMLIARLRWWSNILMLAMVLPLCLFINSLRITLIGVVGNAYGSEAGHQFHDYSGYITLLLCFFILFKYARLLGWKD
jgi:exosortase